MLEEEPYLGPDLFGRCIAFRSLHVFQTTLMLRLGGLWAGSRCSHHRRLQMEMDGDTSLAAADQAIEAEGLYNLMPDLEPLDGFDDLEVCTVGWAGAGPCQQRPEAFAPTMNSNLLRELAEQQDASWRMPQWEQH